MSISVRMLPTGSVRVHSCTCPQPVPLPVPLRRVRLLLARRWSAPMPIGAFLIDHPEGRILFDAGEHAEVERRDFFPRWQIGARRAFEFRTDLEQTVQAQLNGLGIRPGKDIAKVVLSHLHHDHTGALAALGETPVYVGGEHWRAFRSRLRAEAEAAVPRHWPESFAPCLLEPTNRTAGPWTRSYPITADGRVFAVDTPGHTPGHLSLVVRGDQATYLLAGDAAYTLDDIDSETPDGFCADPPAALESLRKIKAFARYEDVVVLPSHDPHAATRLAVNEVYRPRP